MIDDLKRCEAGGIHYGHNGAGAYTGNDVGLDARLFQRQKGTDVCEAARLRR